MLRVQIGSQFRGSMFSGGGSSWRGMVACFVLLAVSAAIGLPAHAQNVGLGTVDGGESVFSLVENWEWNTDGDFEGWTAGNVNNAAVSGGVLSGESLGDGSFPNGADPVFNGPGNLGLVVGVGPGEFNRLQFDVQMGAGSPVVRKDLYFFGTFGVQFQQWTPANFPTITDGNVHTYTLTFDNTSPLWGQTIDNLRFDPVADNQNNVETFAYDFLRLGSSVVPEPMSLVLLLLGGTVGAFMIRRRGSGWGRG